MATKQGISIFNEKLSVQLNADVFDKATDNTVSIKTGEGIKVTSDKGLVLDKTVVTNIAATEVAKIVDGADSSYNTLKEIADYIKSDKTGAANMQNAINANAEAIKTKQDKLGTGSGIVITEDNIITVDGSQLTVKLATNAINATNDANGKSITANYATKNELNGVNDIISAVNNTIKSHTTSIENLTNNKQDNLEFGNGLSTVGNLVKVDTTVLQDIADNKKDIGTLSSSIGGKQDALTFGSGLSFTSSTKTLSVSDTLMTQVTTNKTSISGHNTRIGALESSTQKTLTPENGIYIDSNSKIGVKHDDTLKVSKSGLIGVHIGTGLKTSENSAIVVKMGDGITNDSDLAIKVNHDDTLTTTSEGKLGVNETAITNIAAAKVAEIVANAPDKYDTLKEIADYIKSDEANAATMSNDIATVKGWGNHGTAGYAKKVKVGNTTYEADTNAIVSLPAYPTSLPANGGNAETANKLSTPRKIWGQSFDGSGDISGNLDLGIAKIRVDTLTNPLLALIVGQNTWFVQATEDKMYIGPTSTYAMNIDGSGNVGVVGSLSVGNNSALHTGNIGDGFENVNGTIKISTSYMAEALAGKGLKVGCDGMQVKIAGSLEFTDDNAIYLSTAKESGLVNTGDGLKIGLPIESDATSMLTYEKSLTIGASGLYLTEKGLSIRLATSMDDAQKNASGLEFTPFGMKVTEGKGITVDTNGVGINIGTSFKWNTKTPYNYSPLFFDNTENSLCFKLSTGLKMASEGVLTVKAEELCGSGLTSSSSGERLQVKVSTQVAQAYDTGGGLEINTHGLALHLTTTLGNFLEQRDALITNGLVVSKGLGLRLATSSTIDINREGGAEVVMHSNGGIISSGEGVKVNVGKGFKLQNNQVQLKLSTGLAIDECGCLYVVASDLANT